MNLKKYKKKTRGLQLAGCEFLFIHLFIFGGNRI